MNKQFTRIEEQIRNFSSEVQQVKQRAINIFYFTTHVVTLDVILSNLRRIQDTLINTVTNIYHGRLDVHLLSPAQLQEQLNVISRQVQGEFLVPVNVQNIKELFKMLQVKARITEDYVIIEVKVPLLSTDTYELNRVIPIPQTRNLNSIYVTPSTDYIAFNLRKDTFMSVMENDLQLCIRYNDVNLICPITSPLYELKVGQSICDIKIITDDSNQTYCRRETKECPDRWIKLHSRDTWLYTCCEECKIRILCPSGLATRSLRGSGLISIGQDCILKGDTFSIQGHRDYRSEIYTGNFDIERMANESILNSVINTSTNQLSFVAENHNNTFWKIKGQIQDLLNQSDEEISIEDIHHYVMIYILYFIVVTAIVTAVIYMYRRKLYYIPTARPAAAPAAPAPDSPPPRPTERRVLSSPRTQDKTTSTMFDKIIKFECKIDE